jgi:D-xylose transport system permease protein
VVTLGLGLALNGLQLVLLPPTARYGLMGTGIDKIAETKISGITSWGALVIGLVAFAALVLSGIARRKRAGLEASLFSRFVLPLGAPRFLAPSS